MLVQSQSHRGPLAFAPAYDVYRTVVCFWEARICFPKVIYTVSFLHEGLDRMLRRLRAASACDAWLCSLQGYASKSRPRLGLTVNINL